MTVTPIVISRIGPTEGAARRLVADRHRHGIRAEISSGVGDMGLQARGRGIYGGQNKYKMLEKFHCSDFAN